MFNSFKIGISGNGIGLRLKPLKAGQCLIVLRHDPVCASAIRLKPLKAGQCLIVKNDVTVFATPDGLKPLKAGQCLIGFPELREIHQMV